MVLQQPEKIARRSKAVRGVEGTEQAWRRYRYRWVVAVTKVRDAARFDFEIVARARAAFGCSSLDVHATELKAIYVL